MEGPHFPYDTQEQAEEAAISAHEQQVSGARYGRWAWLEVTDDDRQMWQIPDGYPPYVVFDRGEDDPVLAYCTSWYEADEVAARFARSDDPL